MAVRKSIYTIANESLRGLLRRKRLKAGVSQKKLADRLHRPQSFVSKYESGQRRLDLVELGEVCRALGISLVGLVKEYEDLLP
jgi:transcriptional regulator with XRE-family HTH domain